MIITVEPDQIVEAFKDMSEAEQKDLLTAMWDHAFPSAKKAIGEQVLADAAECESWAAEEAREARESMRR
jgi:hypothetical protein